MNGCVSANILISCETSEDIFVILKDSKSVYVTSPVRRIDVYEQRAGVSNKANWVTEREGLTISGFGENNFYEIGTLVVRMRGYVAATPAANRWIEHPPLTLEKPHYHTIACLQQAKPHIHTHQGLRDKKYNIAAKELKAIEPQMLYKVTHVLINNLLTKIVMLL